jgi:predicted metal-dependent hydrolase
MEEIPVEKIIRSRRRTIGLEITSGATLVVRAPMRASAGDIEEIIRLKSSWILRKIDEIKRRPCLVCHEYAEGEMFLYLGRSYPLQIVESGSSTIERTDRLYVSRILVPDIRNHLKRWYMKEALREIQARCMWFSMNTGHVPATIRITDAKQRWGSCTPTGGVNFSWRLIQAPPEMVDYVVVHELVHLSQPDHSKKFWEKVRKIIPDYKIRRHWLHDHVGLLKI